MTRELIHAVLCTSAQGYTVVLSQLGVARRVSLGHWCVLAFASVHGVLLVITHCALWSVWIIVFLELILAL